MGNLVVEYESVSIVNTSFEKEKLFEMFKLAWHKILKAKVNYALTCISKPILSIENKYADLW